MENDNDRHARTSVIGMVTGLALVLVLAGCGTSVTVEPCDAGSAPMDDAGETCAYSDEQGRCADLPAGYVSAGVACTVYGSTYRRKVLEGTLDETSCPPRPCPFPTPAYSDPECPIRTDGGACITPCDPAIFERCIIELESTNTCGDYLAATTTACAGACVLGVD